MKFVLEYRNSKIDVTNYIVKHFINNQILNIPNKTSLNQLFPFFIKNKDWDINRKDYNLYVYTQYVYNIHKGQYLNLNIENFCNLQVFYGNADKITQVTNKFVEKCIYNNKIIINSKVNLQNIFGKMNSILPIQLYIIYEKINTSESLDTIYNNGLYLDKISPHVNLSYLPDTDITVKNINNIIYEYYNFHFEEDYCLDLFVYPLPIDYSKFNIYITDKFSNRHILSNKLFIKHEYIYIPLSLFRSFINNDNQLTINIEKKIFTDEQLIKINNSHYSKYIIDDFIGLYNPTKDINKLLDNIINTYTNTSPKSKDKTYDLIKTKEYKYLNEKAKKDIDIAEYVNTDDDILKETQERLDNLKIIIEENEENIIVNKTEINHLLKEKNRLYTLEKQNRDKGNFDNTFNAEQYLALYPDLKKNGINTTIQATQHWKNHGRKDGRVGTPKQIREFNLSEINRLINNLEKETIKKRSIIEKLKKTQNTKIKLELNIKHEKQKIETETNRIEALERQMLDKQTELENEKKAEKHKLQTETNRIEALEKGLLVKQRQLENEKKAEKPKLQKETKRIEALQRTMLVKQVELENEIKKQKHIITLGNKKVKDLTNDVFIKQKLLEEEITESVNIDKDKPKNERQMVTQTQQLFTNNNDINIIGLTNINCSTSEQVPILKNYLESTGKNVKIFDITEINKTYHCKNNIICLQPFELSINKLSKFLYKPIAFWIWEFKSLPNIFIKLEKYFSKILTSSNFCLQTFNKKLSIPVEKITTKSQIHNYIDILDDYSIVFPKLKQILEDTDDKILFGYCFDLNSSIIRKNVLNLVKAFSQLQDDKKILILKTRPLRNNPGKLENDLLKSVLKIVNECVNIYYINTEIPILDLYKLYTYLDYYISPHCGEGFGLTIYDNMILGNIIISPYYSGEKDYLDRSKIIELEYQEKAIDGLNTHPIYKYLDDYTGCFVSEEQILKVLTSCKNKLQISNDLDNIEASDYILYFVHLTCTQDFNTGIQRVVRTLSVELNKIKKLILIKYNIEKDDYCVINNDDLRIFMKYGGLNHYSDGYNYNKLSLIYNKIKNEKNVLIIPEIYNCNEYKLFHKFCQLGKDRNYNLSHIYHDDTVYYNNDLDTTNREFWFSEYIKTLSIVDNILPNSYYSQQTYNFHKKRLGLKSNQQVKPIQLGIIGSIYELKCNNNTNVGSHLIVSNISKTERKNYKKLIEAFKSLHNLYPNLKLVIFGNEWDNNIDTTHNIEYRSFVSEQDKDNLFNNCLFSVYPSLCEGYGIPIYESLIRGRCVICHNDTSTLEITNNINQPCVSAVNCNDINILFQEMIKYCSNDYLMNSQKSIVNVKFKTYREYSKELYNCLYNSLYKKLTVNKIFYYIDHTCQTPCRTGIQNYSISLAIELIKSYEIIFVKWDKPKNSLVNCSFLQINHFFNFNLKNPINIDIYKNCKENIEIHKKHNLENYIFICPEATFLTTDNLQSTNELLKYLKSYNLYNVFVVYDLIPILVDGYKHIRAQFKYYIDHLIQADKIICISNKTKKDLVTYYSQFKNNNVDIDYLLLPYQFRDTTKIMYKENKENKDNCINILLSGTIEPRKQQIKLMRIFNDLLKKEDCNVKLIVYGSITESLQKQFDTQLKKTNKIVYLGMVDDGQIIDLYKNASFSCFISTYEGFGLTVAESLWMKTPVLCSNIEPLTEIGRYGGCLFVDPNNDMSIYQGLTKMISNKDYLLQLKNSIKSDYLYNWNVYSNNLINKIINIKQKKTKISVILILYNNLDWFNYFENKINIMTEKYDFDFDFYIYENNSNCIFKERLKRFMTYSKGKFLSETTNTPKFNSVISKERGIYMNNIRNKNKVNHGYLNSDFSWLLDSDVYFDDDILIKYINNFKNDNSLCAVSSRCLMNKEGLENHYYDTLAFSNEKYNYINTGNTCLMKNCNRCKCHRKIVNIFIPEEDLIVPGSVIFPNCAFNSNTLVKTKIYNKIEWTRDYGFDESEWIGFFQNLRNYGRITMDTKIISYKIKK